jgi:hypothetical protein
MSHHDIIIIGGGISGLYLAYKLQKSKKKILLLERSSELGGRIRTEKLGETIIEMGAARFSNKHKLLIKLLKKLNLEDKKIELPKNIDFYFKNKKIKYNLYKKIKNIVSKKKKYKNDYLKKINLYQYCEEILGKEEASKFQDMFGYDAEFIKLNAYSALNMFQEDLLEGESKYYILNGGLIQIIDKLEEFCEKSKNITIIKDSNVKEIKENKVIIETEKNDKIYNCSKIALTIPLLDLKKFEMFKEYEYINGIKEIPLLRIYAKYPLDKNNKPWFHDIKRTTTDNHIRQIIPINYDDGVIMISYTDLYNAEYWNNFCLSGEKKLTEKIKDEISVLFNKRIPDPLEYKFYYWKEGVHVWKTNTDMDIIYNKILNPFDNIYIANESFSKHQCWIEGSLVMVEDLIKKLKKKKKKTIQKGGKKKKQKDKKTKKIKKFPIEKVIKKKNWIIFEHGKQKRIYKIMPKWFKEHPGGKSYLKQGIKANSYYNKKDNDRSDKSPIQLFKSIGAHGSSDILKKYIINSGRPDIIIFIGLLK